MSVQPILYVGTVGEGLWRSVDGGRDWQRLKNGLLSECDVRAIAVNPRQPRHLVVGTNEGVFVSTDAGDQFSAAGGDICHTTVWSLAFSPHEEGHLLAGTRPARVYDSRDQGRSWKQLAAPIEEQAPNPALRYNRVTCVAFDPHEPGRLWVGVEIGGLVTSSDGGITWMQSRAGLSSLDIHGLAIVPGRRLIASTDNDLNLSTDEAQSWQPMQVASRLPYPYCRVLVPHAARPDILYLGNGDGPPGSIGAAARTLDGGQTWQVMSLPGVLNSTVWGFAVHAADPQCVYAATVSGQVFHSRDAGEQWQKLSREFGEIRAIAWSPT